MVERKIQELIFSVLRTCIQSNLKRLARDYYNDRIMSLNCFFIQNMDQNKEAKSQKKKIEGGFRWLFSGIL